MNATELLMDLARSGIQLEADGDRLRYHPRSALSPDLLDRLRSHKAELLTLVRPKRDCRAAGAVDEEFFDANEFNWRQVSDEDRNYLLGPRNYPGPCPWCGGRLVHNPLCDELRQSWEPTFPFGKYAGKRVSEVPREYLAWFVRQTRTDRKLREAIQQRLKSEAVR